MGVVETDEKRLEQVLRNLLGNAFKFTHEGSVTLRIAPADRSDLHSPHLREAERVIGFAVSDTGVGILPEKHKVIFEAFQQADGSVTRTYGGTGLGLSICREIARLLGGEIHLASAPGEGSTFTLYLPARYSPTPLAQREDGSSGDGMSASAPGVVIQTRAGDGGGRPRATGDGAHVPKPVQPPAQPVPSEPVSVDGELQSSTPQARTSAPDGKPSAAQAVAQQGEPDLDALRRLGPIADDRNSIEEGDAVLLIVEDDRAFTRILIDVAHEKGFKAVVAEHGEEAAASLKRYKPAAVTLDLKLPGMHGLTFLDRLKTDPQTRHVPVLIVSVSDELPRGQRKGAVAQLSKPVTTESVHEQLQRMKTLTEKPARRLLVVEDNDDQRRAVGDLMAGDGVDIVGVATGEDAIAALRTGAFDCVVIDLGLPDMSGFELIDTIREELGLVNLPVIVHTGRDLKPEEAKRLQERAEAVVAKDVDAFDRLLDEAALHLHRDEATLPAEQRQMLKQMHRPEATLAGRRVLIVDDDIRNIFALQSLLERHQMDVVYAESGREGLDFLQKDDSIDVVLMDVMMPGMDGYETTQAIRKIEHLADLPVIAVTAKAMRGDREKCLAAGASDYITKPVNVDQLISLLRVWMTK